MKLAVFADGTWNRIEKEGVGTNVVRLHHMCVNDPALGQRTFYDPGVGTNAWQRLQGGLFGVGISQNIKECYSFLVEQWGDDASETAHEVYLFGFSRGAYTVRSLGGLLGRIGLVRSLKDVDEAYELYREGTAEQLAAFQGAKVLTKPRIRMIGVWDTVGALGIPLNWLNQFNPVPHRFHDTTLGPRVEAAYHAVAVDERRVAYQPTLWDALPAGSTQILEQVFFPGVHSDVGGGYEDDRRLGDITLEWMLSRARRRGLQLSDDRLPQPCTVSHCYGLIHTPMRYLPVRREARGIEHGSISGSVRHRWEAPGQACNPYPYETTNLTRDHKFPWIDWPEA